MQASADEVFAAWKGEITPVEKYALWNLAPDLDALWQEQKLAALFKLGFERRVDITNRHRADYNTDWWAATTYAAIQESGWWDYPITIDGSKWF